MAEYSAWFANVTTTNVRVEADSPQQAADIASKRVHASLCHQCARERDDGDWELTAVEDAAGNIVLRQET
ncbi:MULTISPECIES: hypothetical protein [Nocardia]|uniref:hypothetical protein n=1 Tax=Nocardia TaxID=1817 RepID=UPI0024575FB2|nr:MULTISPECIES: hypothetical protein [Nocardia]